MKRLLLVAAIGLIAAPVLAGPDVLPVTGVRHATYNLATGDITPATGNERYGASVWASTARTGYYFGQQADGVGITTLDWGDIEGPQPIGGFAVSYSTDVVLPDLIDCVLLFFADENGFNSVDRVYLTGFNLADLPTGDPGGTWNGWTVTFDLDGAGAAFTIDGADLDADGLMDFGYTFWFDAPEASATGPTMAGDPNLIPQTSPGIENVFDYFTDPNLENYEATYWFGGTPYAQFYLELFDSIPGNAPAGCPEPGGSGNFCWADIDCGDHPCDCVVSLADLAQLLGNYGMTTGATHGMGDVDPVAGDGDVDWPTWPRCSVSMAMTATS